MAKTPILFLLPYELTKPLFRYIGSLVLINLIVCLILKRTHFFGLLIHNDTLADMLTGLFSNDYLTTSDALYR